jgi:hypothetical protein
LTAILSFGVFLANFDNKNSKAESNRVFSNSNFFEFQKNQIQALPKKKTFN